ncbi:MAG: Bor/Iss family lipoprotein [Candidatus Kapaibacteriales bacterium]
MRKFIAVILLISLSIISFACFTQHHVIGEGAKGNQVVTERTWYVLWGLVPINKVDTKEMAKGAKNYEITTQFSFVDVLIGIFTGFFATVYPMTVEVKY